MSDVSPEDLFKKLHNWFLYAKKHNPDSYNAFALSTCVNGVPSSIMVLMKSFDINGFVFFTNFDSKKGKEILINSNVSMLFYWSNIKRQIRINGIAEKISHEQSLEYFNSRPYISKIGALASLQSKVLDKYPTLLTKVAKLSLEYPINPPKPNNWGGFIINPNKIEFWQEKPFRLHVRKEFTKNQTGKWSELLLYP